MGKLIEGNFGGQEERDSVWQGGCFDSAMYEVGDNGVVELRLAEPLPTQEPVDRIVPLRLVGVEPLHEQPYDRP